MHPPHPAKNPFQPMQKESRGERAYLSHSPATSPPLRCVVCVTAWEREKRLWRTQNPKCSEMSFWLSKSRRFSTVPPQKYPTRKWQQCTYIGKLTSYCCLLAFQKPVKGGSPNMTKENNFKLRKQNQNLMNLVTWLQNNFKLTFEGRKHIC